MEDEIESKFLDFIGASLCLLACLLNAGGVRRCSRNAGERRCKEHKRLTACQPPSGTQDSRFYLEVIRDSAVSYEGLIQNRTWYADRTFIKKSNGVRRFK